MSKNENKETNNTVKVKFYKKASFPWAIIIISVVFASGFISGWINRSNQADQVKNEAVSLVTSLKVSR